MYTFHLLIDALVWIDSGLTCSSGFKIYKTNYTLFKIQASFKINEQFLEQNHSLEFLSIFLKL